ncbi:MAG: NAD(P)-binding protein [Bacteroidales bacterium]|nr:NAD(P)-binding protein [Bacteroidales bacterium]
MDNNTSDNSIIIIGAGFAGLAAGIYAQMNGYQTQIFEMHNKPGGLCTSWERKGYTIDCCIHWLVGSSPESSMHDFWEEVGITQGRQFINKEPVEIGEAKRNRLYLHLYNHDPSMAPAGKTVLTIMINTDYEYWKKLAQNKTAYLQKKEEIAKKLIELLDQRFPGISSQVEVIDVATPMTFERYTGNWKGSFEGWLITPENASVLMKPMSQSLPGLANFYMCGQWVEPGGGLPTGIMSGRRLIKSLCREDRRKFRTIPVKVTDNS